MDLEEEINSIDTRLEKFFNKMETRFECLEDKLDAIELNMSPNLWLSIPLIGGGVFCLDLIIEFVRLTYAQTGSDYVRLLMQTKKGWGWNDENKEIEVT